MQAAAAPCDYLRGEEVLLCAIMNFGDRLSALRQECGYSQFQLASLVGVSDKAVSKWETGVAKPRMKTCQRLAAVLGVDLDELFSSSEHNSSSGGNAMNKKKLWAAAEERLYSLYGEEPDFALINRFKTEKNFLTIGRSMSVVIEQ